MDEKVYVVSLRTLEHLDGAYIGCHAHHPKATPPSSWFISPEPAEVYAFSNLDTAVEFKDKLNQGEAYGLANDGRVWITRLY